MPHITDKMSSARIRRLLASAMLVMCFAGTRAQNVIESDSLRLTIQKADSIFLKENLLLLSRMYSVSAADAMVIQAKAYPNPVISADLNAIDPQNEKFFNIGPTGQKEFAIEQLLIMGGKRKSSISIARQNKEIAESELADLLRNLRFELHSSLYLLNKHKVILDSYKGQLLLLDELIASYETQAARGNLPIKDVIRLKSVYLRISNNRIEETSAYLEEVRKIQILLHTTSQPLTMIDEAAFVRFSSQRSFNDLVAVALENRPDYKQAQQQKILAGTMLKLQKQMVVPDLLLNSGYDQQGGAFRNQVQVGVSVPLPLWNRNKGAIKAAGYDQINTEIMLVQKKNQVQAEVTNAVDEMRAGIIEYTRARALYTNDFNDVFRGVNENFSRRNISILEFVDFFEAYNESLADFQRIKTQLALLAEQINFVTSSNIY